MASKDNQDEPDHGESDHLDLSLAGSSSSNGAFLDEETGHSSDKHNSSTCEDEKLDVGKRETRNVFRLRLVVFGVILVAAIAVSLLVYYTTSNAEKDEYNTQYEGAAEKILESFLDVAATRLGSISSLAIALTSQGTDQNQDWPFVALSNFQQRVATIRDQSGALYIHVNPFVMESDRLQWEEYLTTGEGSHWLDEGIAYQEEIGLFDYEGSSSSNSMATVTDHSGHSMAATTDDGDGTSGHDMDGMEHSNMDGNDMSEDHSYYAGDTTTGAPAAGDDHNGTDHSSHSSESTTDVPADDDAHGRMHHTTNAPTEAAMDHSMQMMSQTISAPTGAAIDHSMHVSQTTTDAPVNDEDHSSMQHTTSAPNAAVVEGMDQTMSASHNMSSHAMQTVVETSPPTSNTDHSMHNMVRHLQAADGSSSNGDAHHDHSVYTELITEDSWSIWYHNQNKEVVYDEGPGPYMPTFQSSPIFYFGHETNENILKSYGRSGGYKSFSTESVVISEFLMAPPGDRSSSDPQTSLYARLLSANLQQDVDYQGDPFSQVFVPIFDSLENNKTAVGVVVAWVHWMTYFMNILPSSLAGIFVVMSDSCSNSYTYSIDGTDVTPLGVGSLQNSGFEGTRRSASFDIIRSVKDGTRNGLPLDHVDCVITIDVYPSQVFYATYNTNTPIYMSVMVAGIFGFTAFLFFLFDRIVERRQSLVMEKARQTNRIVTSLFPKNVRERLFEDTKPASNTKRSTFSGAPNRRLKGFLTGSVQDDAAPIADLFPYCTVCFSDIAGFTAWSSTREPAQVFILLQSVYAAFDKIAKRRKVFKVETIGDSYMAVTGLPEPQANHAIIMSRFAAECNTKMRELTSQLENTLGPDTADLSMRFGLHSGPVTAGVLRGDRARFQLFGDTVNTAARMESTGLKNKIQISPQTYDLLAEGGKTAWAKPREDAVHAKGKGILATYWLDLRPSRRSSSVSGSSNSAGDDGGPTQTGALASLSSRKQKAKVELKQARLVNWIVEIMDEHMGKLLALRGAESRGTSIKSPVEDGRTPLDDVAEVIYLPRFDKKQFFHSDKFESSQMGPEASEQLHEYVSIIASFYNSNPFHNFEHACHVTMATNKLLKRIVAPDIAIHNVKDHEIANQLHDFSYGITSDPLTILAILFSALIHDAGHEGVSNGQLSLEKPELKNKYNNKSVAEQNSLDISWDLLMEDRFAVLRKRLFTTSAEIKRFRQVLVNVVLATDIFDKELNGLRKTRWDKAFSTDGLSDEEKKDLRATIVIEHIIQASDVSHTMQHWHIYRKWNARLFEELYVAFREGRMGADPSKFWYNGEIGFFDNYIIPLAKKLKDCQVFGVSSDECLNYAVRNRNEWKERGEQIVKEMLEEIALKVDAHLKAKAALALQTPILLPEPEALEQATENSAPQKQGSPPSPPPTVSSSSSKEIFFDDIVEC